MQVFFMRLDTLCRLWLNPKGRFTTHSRLETHGLLLSLVLGLTGSRCWTKKIATATATATPVRLMHLTSNTTFPMEKIWGWRSRWCSTWMSTSCGRQRGNRPLIVDRARWILFGWEQRQPRRGFRFAEDLAHMGYVVASISYRFRALTTFSIWTTSFIKAVWRGVHDSRAAVRFFRRSVEEGNPYAIDPNRILLGSVSAGSFLAMHHAMDDSAKFRLKWTKHKLGWVVASKESQAMKVTTAT